MPEINHILDRLAIPFFFFDRNGAFNYMNKKAEEFFDCNLTGFIGKKIDEVPSFHQFLGIYRRAMAEQRNVCLQDYCKEKVVWLEHHIYPAEDGLTACIIDITEKEKIREDERIHLSHEVHDELGQQLTALMMDFSWLDKYLEKKEERIRKKIDDIMDLLNITVETVRRISTDLHPQIVDDLRLPAALEWQNLEFEKSSGVSVKFQCRTDNPAFPSDIAICLFRIYRESLTNIARHADAQMVSTTL
jgi:PAS domain S-box-containing protein